MKNLNKFDALYNQIISEMVEESSNTNNDEICKDWGYLNDMPNDKEKSDAFDKARDAHEQMEKDDPEHHKLIEYPSRWGAGATYECKCGFSYKVDSSRIKLN